MGAFRATTPGFQDERYRALILALVEKRKAISLTQGELATRLGTHKQFVSRVELGERRLDAVEFVDYARALGLDPALLLEIVPQRVFEPGAAPSKA